MRYLKLIPLLVLSACLSTNNMQPDSASKEAIEESTSSSFSLKDGHTPVERTSSKAKLVPQPSLEVSNEFAPANPNKHQLAPPIKPKQVAPKEEQKAVKAFRIVEEMPRFPGCEDINDTALAKRKCAEKKMLQFIFKHFRYPPIAREICSFSTKVFIRFLVNTDGSLSNIEIVREPGGGIGEAMVNVIKKMPKWIPGKQDNQVVPVEFMLPVTICLE